VAWFTSAPSQLGLYLFADPVRDGSMIVHVAAKLLANSANVRARSLASAWSGWDCGTPLLAAWPPRCQVDEQLRILLARQTASIRPAR
jgi:hypothetical protein